MARTPLTRNIYAAVTRSLGGRPRDLTEEEIGKLSEPAQRQLFVVLNSLENKRPSSRDLMNAMARGRLPIK